MVVLGLLASMGGAGVSGVWFVFIGLFITFASTAEAAQTERDLLLGGLRVRDVMTPEPLTAPGSISVASLVDQYILRQHVSAYPVIDDLGRPVALMTLERVRAVPAGRRNETSVRAVAAPISEVVVASPDDPVNALVPRLATSREGRALVLDQGRLVGIVSHTDIIRALELRQLTPPPPRPPPRPHARPSPPRSPRGTLVPRPDAGRPCPQIGHPAILHTIPRPARPPE